MKSIAAAILAIALGVSLTAGGRPDLIVTIPTADKVALTVSGQCVDVSKAGSIKAVAEGIVDGQRQTIPLTLTRTSSPNTYAVSRQWPSKGTWVISLTFDSYVTVSTLVTLGPDGSYVGASVQNLRRAAQAADIAKALNRL